MAQKKELVCKGEKLSISRQCKLLGLNRSSYYYQSRGEKEENLELMKEIDKEYLAKPYYGSRRMAEVLRRKGFKVGRKRVRRLMRLMDLKETFA